MRSGSIVIYQTSINVWEEEVEEPGIRLAMRGVLGHMVGRGYVAERDPATERHYPTLSGTRWLARKGELRAIAEQGGRHFKIEFYQELHVDNPNGGRYDFDKFNRMHRTMQLECVVEVAAVCRKLRALGYSHSKPAIGTDPSLLAIRDAICPPCRWGTLDNFNAQWNFESDWKRGVHRFERDETGWPSAKATGHHRDRDGVPIVNGDVRYIRQRGRLARGVVHPNMNGMWFVGDFAYVSSRDLFYCDPSHERRRFVAGQQRRLRAEIEKSVEACDYPRVEALARVLASEVAAPVVSE